MRRLLLAAFVGGPAALALLALLAAFVGRAHGAAAAPGCAVRLARPGAAAMKIHLSGCPGLRLGDVQAALGPPDGVQPGLLAFAFRGGRVRVRLAADGCAPRLSPYLPVADISLGAGGALAGAAPWRGFMPPARYLRLYPGTVLLSC